MENYLERQTSDVNQNLPLAQDFIKYTNLELNDISKAFVKIGYRLWEANECKFFLNLGYENIYELAESEFGFKSTSVKNLIQIAQKFTNDNAYMYVRPKMQLAKRWENYTQSQLVEMCSIEPINCEKVTPEMTIAQIREFKKYNKEYGIRCDETIKDFVTRCKMTEADEKLLKENQIKIEMPADNVENDVKTEIETSQTSDEPKQEKDDYLKDYWTDNTASVEKIEEPTQQVDQQETLEESEDAPESYEEAFGDGQSTDQPTEKLTAKEPRTATPSGRLNLKNQDEREQWLKGYKTWDNYLNVPELNLKGYKYILANGAELIALQTLQACWDYTDNLKIEPKDEVIVNYYLIIKNVEQSANVNYAIFSKYFNSTLHLNHADSKSAIVGYLTKKAKEI